MIISLSKSEKLLRLMLMSVRTRMWQNNCQIIAYKREISHTPLVFNYNLQTDCLGRRRPICRILCHKILPTPALAGICGCKLNHRRDFYQLLQSGIFYWRKTAKIVLWKVPTWLFLRNESYDIYSIYLKIFGNIWLVIHISLAEFTILLF